MKSYKCAVCQKEFRPRVNHVWTQKYCSARCRNRENQRKFIERRKKQGAIRRWTAARTARTTTKPVPGGGHHPRPKVSPQGRETQAKGILESDRLQSDPDNPLESLVNAFLRQQGLEEE